MANGNNGNENGNGWAGAIGSAAATGIGMIGEKKRYERGLRGQEHLMGIQLGNQQQLNQQGHDLQMEAWKKTNYPAQVKMLEAAGLNPALMYGMSGGGGTTAGSQGGGSAQGGNAPSQGNIDLPLAMLGAQIENLKAQTEKTKEETTNIAGGERENLQAQFDKLTADKDLTKQIEKTEVNRTEEAKYKAALEKLSAETGEKYNYSPIDSFLIKTMSRIGGDIAGTMGDMDFIGGIIKWLWEDGGKDEMLDNLDPNKLEIYIDKNGVEKLRYKK